MATQRVSSTAVVQRLHRAGNFAGALAVAQRLLEQAREQHDEREVLQHLEEVAYLHKELREYDEALTANDELLAIHRRSTTAEKTKELVEDLSRGAFFLSCAGRYEAAEEQFQQAREAVMQLPAEERAELPTILLNLGYIANQRGDLDLAKHLLLKAWSRSQDCLCTLQTAIHIVIELADAFRSLDRAHIAKRFLDKGVQTFDIDDYLPYAPLLIAELHVRRASLQYAAGQPRAALVSYERALRIVEQWGGENLARRDEFVERIRSKILRVSRGFE
jgi:tetratricopeptide (TPR) repeat protein